MIRSEKVFPAALVLLAAVLVFGSWMPSSAAESAAKTTPAVEAALADPGHPGHLADDRLLVWVFFRDKGLSGAALESALASAQSDLAPRTARRRARTRPAGARLVDAGDLPLAPAYIGRVAATGAGLRHTSRWLNAASCLATPGQLALLAALPEVAKIDLVARELRRGPSPLPEVLPERRPGKNATGDWTWDYGSNRNAMEQVNVPPLHLMGLTGRDVVVGMLDTGFRTTHEALRHIEILDEWDFVDDDPIVDTEPGDPSGSRNHGTMTLSTVAASRSGKLIAPAPGVSVLLARTEHLSEEYPAEEDHWVAGMEWCEAGGADIISSSLGYKDWYEFSDLDGNTAVTTRAADMAAARGLLVVTSAGNYGFLMGGLLVPGDADSVITVGAVDAVGIVASFSSRGPTADGRFKPDVAALGVQNTVADPNDDRNYGGASGTSFSCPLVAGVTALMLERAPSLTPIQVRTALRSTADRTWDPDNDTGWGIIDAYQAATWFGPVFDHQSLPDTENTAGPYTVTAQITARAGMSAAPPQVVWRGGGGAWQTMDLMPTGGGPVAWFADLPGQPAGTVVDYYLTGTDLDGVTVTEPVRGPDRFHTFTVGPDLTPPVVDHWPVSNQTLFVWPPTVRCTATDNLGMAGVDLRFRVNGGAEQGPFPLGDVGADQWELVFPLTTAQVAAGDHISYDLTAYDAAAAANSTLHGPRSFDVIPLDTVDAAVADTADHAVPDDDPGGTFGYIVVDATADGVIWELEVDVDLVHPDVSELRITLTSPLGTMITLHDRSGGGADLAGTWPTTLAVDGPGALADYVGENSGGLWFLHVYDEVSGQTGTLRDWGLRFTFIDEMSGAGDGTPRPPDLLHPAVPNPFNPSTSLRFELVRPGRTRLAVYDLRGMLVRDLLNEVLTAGPHSRQWDGRDRHGRDLGSGVYLYRLVTPDGAVRERKMTLLR